MFIPKKMLPQIRGRENQKLLMETQSIRNAVQPIVSRVINPEFTAPPDVIYFFTTFWDLKKATKQAQRESTLIQNPASKQTQEISIFNIKPDIQTPTEGQQPHYRIQHVNDTKTRRKQSPLDCDITIKLKHCIYHQTMKLPQYYTGNS